MTDVVHAEWTKVRTLPGTGWLLLAAAALTVAVGAVAANAVTCPAGGCQLDPAKVSLTGVDLGQAIVAIVAVTVVSGEYSTGMIRLTLAATPRRWRVLAAKAVVLAAVTFAAGLVAAVIVIPVGERLLHENGNPIPPVTMLTWLQVVVGTAALLAVSAVLGLAVGTLLRRSAGAVTAVIAGIVLPYLLATVPGILPVGAEQWLLRVTPAAGFAVQGTLTQYPQVNTVYTPGTGYFPLAPWAGFAVLCAWAAAALVLALFLLRRRDT